MYRLLSSLSKSELLFDTLPPLLVSMGIAEFFYKFHSFTLECCAFLVTWATLDAVAMRLRRLVTGR